MNKLINLTVFLLLTFVSVFSFATPIAMVMDVKGNVLANNKQVVLLTELELGTTLTITAESSLTLVYLNTGQEYIVAGAKNAVVKEDYLQIEGKKQQGEQLLASAQGLALGNYSQAAVIMRSGNTQQNSLTLYSPNSTGVLKTHPLLSWKYMGKGFQYRVEVMSESGDSLFTINTDKNSTAIPQNISLPREELLSWEVEAIKGITSHINMADFFIASIKDSQQINEVLKKKNKSFSQRLLLAWMLENKGFSSEALKYWKLLATERPDNQIIQSKLK